MTARTTTLKGVDTGRYYVEALPSYYLDSGEPAGRWRGAGAAELGLHGEVDEDDFLQLMAGHDPRTGRDLGTKFIDRSARAYDVTCSAPKSVSVLFALGDVDVRTDVLQAHDAAVTAVVDWIERHAHTRFRVNGEVQVVDVEGIAAATFRQHTSRALDPQLHTHIVIASRVLSPDGRWLALDARTIKHDQRTLSAVYHAGLRSEVTRRLGVRWQKPVNGIAEMLDAPDDVLHTFSRRTAEVDARIEEKLDRFTATFDRAPTPRERWRLEREAVTESRPAKTGCDASAVHEEWIERAASIGIDPAQLTEEVLDRAPLQPPAVDRNRLADAALAALGEKQSTWRVAELVRELAAALPTTAERPAAEIAPWLDELADEIIAERCLDLSRPVPNHAPLRRDGRPTTESAVDRVLTLPAILAEEERLLELAEQRLATPGSDADLVDPGDLAGAQLDVANAVAGIRELVLVVGPAGTGKTTALRPAVEQLRREGRAVFGLAPSAAAAEVLDADAGLAADTLDKLLIEHRLDRPPDHRYDLPPGATVVLDEAAMASTPKLAELADLAERRSWRLILIGDPLQFSAIGRSGMFGHIVDSFGAIELATVHRFGEAWEREASLRLRRGDVAIVDTYDEHGRLHGGTASQMRAKVLDVWWQATTRGESVALMAPTREAVLDLNQRAQQLRLDAGELRPGPTVAVGPYEIHVGDVVATRHNDRHLVTDRNLMVKNRDQWLVTGVGAAGTLTVEGRTGRVELPVAYVQDHIELAYATTSHAAQGRTVDRSLFYLDGPTNAAGVYVPLTRGRSSNEVFAVCRGEDTAVDVVAESLTRSWIDRPAIAHRQAIEPPADDQSRDATADLLSPAELRNRFERQDALERQRWNEHFAANNIERELTSIRYYQSGARETIDANRRELAKAERYLEQHSGSLDRLRHRHEIDNARSNVERATQRISDAEASIVQLEERTKVVRARVAEVREGREQPLERELATVVDRLTADARTRAGLMRDDPPDLLVEHLGRRPTEGPAVATWDDAAGRVAQHREAHGITGPRLLGTMEEAESSRAYLQSSRAADQALAQLDRSLGRHLTIEPPGRSLGISL
ncbi:MAG TPA: MobF family relaxase [Acidimicrobiales bacterium]|nr:MobF family relaxase [Acidimicrobiales bacterium]